MSELPLAGRVAIVTGASRGIGRSIAETLATAGASVVLVSRSADALAGVVGSIAAVGGRAIAVPADVTDDDAAARVAMATLDAFGGIDVLVNNAGGNSFSVPMASMRMAGWQKTMALNVDSTVRMIQAALPSLITSGHGSIVNVSSITGLRGVPTMSHYAAAKAAVISLTQSVAVEVAPAGVRVNALAPGWVETDLTGFLRADDELEHGILDRVPMGRWGRPEEIAQGALFLASDASSFMTGQTLVIDGGLAAH
jgi:NAD(P)-dependent dehydrogenase (short-subunit alcohol dehydrogenase family)